ncbi:MAG: DUF1697 domain-containing protein [Candidatus Altimarinota bacterium]
MKYVAFLRGINVGGNKKVEMTRLKSCFEAMGFEEVSTYINSGNMIFESKNDDFSKIEKQLSETFGFEIPTIIRSQSYIENLVEKIPSEWQNNSEQRTDILFLWKDVDTKESLNEIKQNPLVDTLTYLPGAIIWHIDKAHYQESKMRDFIGTKVYRKMTARNVNTVRKIRELM